MTELRPALLVIAAVAGLLAVVDLGLALEVTDGVATAVHILVPIVGLSFVGAGLAAWSRRPSNHSGLLMTATGSAWLVAGLVQASAPLAFTIGLIAIYPSFALLGHTLIAFPTGRLRSRVERVVVVALYVTAIAGTAPTLLNDQVRWNTFLSNVLLSCSPCPRNLFDTFDFNALSTAGTALRLVAFALALGAAIIALAARWLAAPPAWRRVLLWVVPPGIVGLFLLLIASVLAGVNVAYRPQQTVGLVALALLALVPAGMFVVIARAPFGRMSSDLKLGQAGAGELARDELTSRVRDALGDPTAQLLYWNPDEDGYLDAAGNAYETPGPEDHRALTELGYDGERVGAIVHDEWLGDEAETMRRISGVLALAISNERLAAAVGRALDEVQASRERIARAGDQERRRIARDLHDGAQQRLLGLALKARLLARQPAQGTATELDRLGDELDQAANELRGFVHGILPPALERHGLAAALRDASASLPVPTSVVELGSLDARPDPDIEQTAYFIAAEALTNVTKHARASQVEVEIARSDDRLIVEVRDDGVGGAALGDGAGMRSMSDRAEAVSGRLRLESSPGAGTQVHIDLPWSAARTVKS